MSRVDVCRETRMACSGQPCPEIQPVLQIQMLAFHLGVINILSCCSSFSFLLGNRFLSQQNESRIAMTDLRPSLLSDAIPLFRFHFGRNNCLEPLERRVAVALPRSAKWLKRGGKGSQMEPGSQSGLCINCYVAWRWPSPRPP